MRGCRVFLVGAAVVAAANIAEAGSTQFEWNSSATGNWTDATKWTPNGIPGAVTESDEVNIGSGAGDGGIVILDSAVPSIERFNIGDGGEGTLDIRAGGSLTTTTMLSADAIGLNRRGTLLMSGGMLTLGRRLVINNGIVDISGGTLELPNTLIGDLNLGLSGVADITVRGTGRLDVGRDLIIGDGGEGLFTLGGGQANVTRNLVVGGPFGIGTLSITGGQLNVSGDTIVGGQLGAGTLNLHSGTADVVTDAFSVSADGTLHLGVGTTVSPIRASTASLAGELTVAFDISPSVGAVYPLVRVAPAGIHETTFENKPEGAVFLADDPAGGVPVRISYEANLDGGAVGNDVTLTVLSTVVNRADIARVAGNWHGTGGPDEGDVDGNGIVNLLDLMALQRSIGTAPSSAAAAAVPEPSAWASLLAAMAMVAIFSRLGLASGANRR